MSEAQDLIDATVQQRNEEIAALLEKVRSGRKNNEGLRALAALACVALAQLEADKAKPENVLEWFIRALATGGVNNKAAILLAHNHELAAKIYELIPGYHGGDVDEPLLQSVLTTFAACDTDLPSAV